MKRSDAADSTVLSTIILASALIVIVGAAYAAANNTVNYQLESAQFEQAQNVLVSLARVIKNAMLNPFSSGYVRSSFWKTIPQFEDTDENMTLTIADIGENWTYNIDINAIKIKGGPMIGVLTPRTILGNDNNDSLLFTDAGGSLAQVRIFQSNGAWVSLDYQRVRCVYIGNSTYYNGAEYESFNVFEVTMVNFTFGTFQPETQVLITVQNLGFGNGDDGPGPKQFSNNTSVSISLNGGEQQETYQLADLVSEQGGDPSKPVLVNVVIVNIECSMLKGG